MKFRLIATKLSILEILINNSQFFHSSLVYRMPPRLWSSLTQEEIQVSRKVRFVIAIFLPNLTRFFGFLNFLATNSISFQCFRVKTQLHSVVQEVV